MASKKQDYWYLHNFFKNAAGTILVLLIILLLYHVFPVFAPLLNFIAVVTFPIVFAALLYYILRPSVKLLERIKIPRVLAILLLYCILVAIIIFINSNVLPDIIKQIGEVTSEPSEKIKMMEQKTSNIMDALNIHLFSTEQLQAFLGSYMQKINNIVSQFILFLISAITGIAIVIILTPFILFYFLKDDYLFPLFFLKLVPHVYQSEAKVILKDVDETLSSYIIGQTTIACIIGSLLFLCYFAIGLNHALVLALFATIFYTIPFLGTIISLIPALMVALSESSFMGLKVVIAMAFVHLLETNLITPNILGQRLQIHPLTVIFLLLAAGYLYGLIGLLVATPIYAILKVIIWNLYKIYRLRDILHKKETE